MEPSQLPAYVPEQQGGAVPVIMDGSKKRPETVDLTLSADQQVKKSKLDFFLKPTGHQLPESSHTSMQALGSPASAAQNGDTEHADALSPLKRKAEEIGGQAASGSSPPAASATPPLTGQALTDARAEERRRLRELQERERKEKEEAKKKREEDKKKREEERKRKEEEKAKREEEKKKKEAEKAEEKKRKEEEKKKKEEEKKKRDEEKQQKGREKEETKRKREEEKKRKEDEKAAKRTSATANTATGSAATPGTGTAAESEAPKPAPPPSKSRMFMESFVKKKAAADEKKQSSPEELIKEEYSKYVHPAGLFRCFVPDKNMRMAPISRAIPSQNTEWLQRLQSEGNVKSDSIEVWRSVWKAHRGSRKRSTRPWATLLPKDVRRTLSNMKTLIFHDNTNKPPYHGTFSKRTSVIGPRRPFAMASAIVDYECDSDEEWEEEDPGEDLEDEQLLKEEEGGAESDNSDDLAIVPDGYLSADEGGFGASDNESGKDNLLEGGKDTNAPEDPIEAAKKRHLRKLLHEEAKKNMYLEPRKEMLDKLITLRIGPIFDERQIRDDPKSAILAEFAAMPLVSLPCNLDAQPPPGTPGSAASAAGNAGEGIYSPKLKQFPEPLLIAFIRHIHGKPDGIEKLLKEFQPPADAGTMSRRQLELKLKQADFVRKERRGQSGMDLQRWWVRPEVLASLPSCADLLAALPPAPAQPVTSPSPTPAPASSAATPTSTNAAESEPIEEIAEKTATTAPKEKVAPIRKFFAPKQPNASNSVSQSPSPSPSLPTPVSPSSIISRTAASAAGISTPRRPAPGSPSTPRTPARDPKLDFDELESALEKFSQNDANLCVAKLRAFSNRRRMSAVVLSPSRSLCLRLADLISSVSSDLLRRECASLLAELLPLIDAVPAAEVKPWCMTWNDVIGTSSYVVAAAICLQPAEDAKLLGSGFKLVEILMTSPVREDIAALLCTQPQLLSSIASKITSAEAQTVLEKILSSPAGSSTLKTDANLAAELQKVVDALQSHFDTTKSQSVGQILEKLKAIRSPS